MTDGCYLRDMHACHLGRSAIALLTAAGLAAGAPGQQDRWQTLVDRTSAQLADPAQRLGALRTLEHLGPRLVPILRQRLDANARRDASQQLQTDLLWVLSRFGRDALPALRELRDIVRGDDVVVAIEAVATLTALAPFLTEDQAVALRDDLERAYPDVQNQTLAGLLAWQLQLGSAPDHRTLAQYLLYSNSVACTAACRWLLVHAAEDFAGRDEVLLAVEASRLKAMQRLEVTFDRDAHFGDADLAEAWLALTRQPLDALAARGLLSHRLPDERRRGVAWLADNGRALPRPERADLVVRLWDGDAGIVVAACNALAGWGQAGLVGLAPLRQFAATHPDPDARAACAAAADTIVAAATAAADPDDAALVRALDLALCGEPAGPPPAGLSAAGQGLAADVLHLAQWHDPSRLAHVLELLDVPEPGPAIAGKVYSWLPTTDADLSRRALAWLARHGATARAVIDASTQGGVYGQCVSLPRFCVPGLATTAAIEATAWFLTVDAPRAELADLLDDGNTRWVARALAELVSRSPDELAGLEPRLHELLALPADTPLRVGDPTRWYRPMVHPSRLAEPIRVLAALALAAREQVLPDTNGLGEFVRRRCGVPLADLVAFVAEQRRTGALPALLDAIEAECRTEIGVPPELRWASLAER